MGDPAAVIRYGVDRNGGGILVNASRSVLYASSGRDFASAARGAAEGLRVGLERERTASLSAYPKNVSRRQERPRDEI